jgi:anti-anti-sigma factor
MFRDRRRDGDLASTPADFAGVVAVSPFRLSETDIGEGCREIRVEGELDLAVSDQLEEAIVGGQGERILINLEACQFIDSTGIAMIVRAHCRETPRVVVHSPSGQVLRVLEVTGLTADGPVYADREQALSALVRPVSS